MPDRATAISPIRRPQRRSHDPPATSPPHVNPQGTSSVRVHVVEPEHFEALGGLRVEPLHEDNQYGGWRLP
jgi:hypothetical protein